LAQLTRGGQRQRGPIGEPTQPESNRAGEGFLQREERVSVKRTFRLQRLDGHTGGVRARGQGQGEGGWGEDAGEDAGEDDQAGHGQVREVAGGGGG